MPSSKNVSYSVPIEIDAPASRVRLKWIVTRVRHKASATEGAFDWAPQFTDGDWTGSNFSADFAAPSAIDVGVWKAEISVHQDLFATGGNRLPAILALKRDLLALLLFSPLRPLNS